MPETAKYSLEDVRKLIETDEARGPNSQGEEQVWFSAPSKSISAVIDAYLGESGGPQSVDAAKLFIYEGIKKTSLGERSNGEMLIA